MEETMYMIDIGKITRRGLVGLCFALVAFGGLTGQSAPAAAQKAVSIGTASASGTLYIVGAGLAQLITKDDPNLRVSAEATAGSVENINLVLRHKLDIGMSSYLVIPRMMEKADLSDLRIITMGHSGFLHFFVRKDSPIKSIDEIKGKRVAVGAPGSAAYVAVQTALKYGLNLSMDDVKAANLDIPATINAIKDGSIDVGTIGSATPVAALIELSSTVGIRFLPMTKEQIDGIAANSSFVPGKLDAGTYQGQDQDVDLVAYPPVVVYAHKDMDADVVYQFIKTVFEHPKERDAIHPQAKYYSKEFVFRGTKAMREKGFPFHPGAERYLKEIGIWDRADNAFAKP
jgi:uncharacterized protein